MPGLTVEEKRQLREEPAVASAAATTAAVAPPRPRKQRQQQKKRTWDESFEALAAYRNAHGDCYVPARYEEDRGLGNFVSKIRQEGRAALAADRRERLGNLGFDWETTDERFEREWNESFDKLECYKSRFGHCRVPNRWKEDPKLGSWVSTQRVKQSKGTLLSHREAKLRSIEFTWTSRTIQRRGTTKHDEKWLAQYRELGKFKRKNGHCSVPSTYVDDRALGRWVVNQRVKYAQNDLPTDRMELLNGIGFVWRLRGADAVKRGRSGGEESSPSAKRQKRAGEGRRSSIASMCSSSDGIETHNVSIVHGSFEQDMDRESGSDSETSGYDNSITKREENGRTKSEDRKVPGLNGVKVGQRIAMEFGDSEIKFGQVEICFTEERDPEKWTWHVSFDDGETYAFDRDEMTNALDTYRRFYDAEMSDPNRLSKVAAIVAAFEIRKQLVMSMMPDDYKKHFLQVGFAKWAGSYQGHLKYFPVLFLGPYDVPEGPLRKRMYSEIEKAQKKGKKMPRLVYWYGEKMEEAFSFVPQNLCMTYEKGVAKGLHELPKPLQAKLDKGMKFTKDEEKLLAARDQMEEDLPKDPVDRIRFEKPKEDHEYIVDGDWLIAEIEAVRGGDLLTWCL